MKKKTVAIMQPYWIPYAGYFRLFKEADYFVFLDDVQFPRRGYVHRNRLEKANGSEDWMTLPLKRASRSALINQIELRDAQGTFFESQKARFPAFNAGYDTLSEEIQRADHLLVNLLISTLEKIRKFLEIDCICFKSSDFQVAKKRGQERILFLVKELGATRYVNASGGRHLYDRDLFNRSGVELSFLEPWKGGALSIIQEYAKSGSWTAIQKNLSE